MNERDADLFLFLNYELHELYELYDKRSIQFFFEHELHELHELYDKRSMNTAILVFILIVIAIAIFYFGIAVGGWAMSKRLADVTVRAILDSDLTGTQQMKLIDKIKEYEGKPSERKGGIYKMV